MKNVRGFFYGLAIAIAMSATAATVYNYFPPPGMTYSPTTGFVVGSATGGAQGAGTVNAQGVYINGAAALTSAGLPVGANPTGTVGLTAVNGSAATFLRSDGAPALSQAIVPTWTSVHTFSASGGGQDFKIDNTAGNGAYFTFLRSGSALADVGNSAQVFSGGTLDNLGISTRGAQALDLGTNGLKRLQVTSAGGVVVGSATGGDEGIGTVNMQGCFVNGVACSTGGAAAANPTGTVGLAAVNGSAGTFLRSDGAPALSQAITPTWTGLHKFQGNAVIDLPASSAGYGVLEIDDQTPSRKFQAVFIGSTAAGVYGATAGNVVLDTASGVSLTFSTADAARMLISSSGATSINAPGSGDTLTLTALASNHALLVNGANNAYTLQVTGGATSGQSFGEKISAGTTSADVALNVTNQAQTLTLANIKGDGSFQLGNNGTTSAITGTAAGAISIAAPSATATAATVTAAVNASSLILNGAVNTAGGIGSYVEQVNANAAGSGFDNGLIVQAGATASDTSLYVRSQNGGTNFLLISGDGGAQLGAPTGGDKGLGTLNLAGTYYQNGTAVIQSGTFTATLTGMTSVTTGTMGYSVAGSTCTIWATGGGATGTSNAVTFTITGMPAVCIPAIANGVMFGDTVTDNGIAAPVGVAEVAATTGTIVMGLLQNGASRPAINNNGWTASGTKGINSDFVITFHL